MELTTTPFDNLRNKKSPYYETKPTLFLNLLVLLLKFVERLEVSCCCHIGEGVRRLSGLSPSQGRSRRSMAAQANDDKWMISGCLSLTKKSFYQQSRFVMLPLPSCQRSTRFAGPSCMRSLPAHAYWPATDEGDSSYGTQQHTHTYTHTNTNTSASIRVQIRPRVSVRLSDVALLEVEHRSNVHRPRRYCSCNNCQSPM